MRPADCRVVGERQLTRFGGAHAMAALWLDRGKVIVAVVVI
jgi:hypothetical protein